MAAHIPGKLHYEPSGTSGPVMLFMHGNPYDHRLWLYQTAHFSTWFRTVAIDFPGYGRSPPGQPGLKLGDMADACWEVLDEVARGEPAILVGNSVGASTAIFMSGKRPTQVRGMILTGCAYNPNRDFARMGGKGWDEHGIGARKAGLDRFTSPSKQGDAHAAYLKNLFLETNDRVDPKAVREIFRALEEDEPEAYYDAISVPCIILAGTEDPSFPGAGALQKRIRNAELVKIEGGSHVSNLDFPALWDAHALEFIERHKLKS